MKTTLKLDNAAALVVQPDGIHVSLSITVGSIQIQKKLLDVATCGALLAAIEGAANEAEKYAAALARAGAKYP